MRTILRVIISIVLGFLLMWPLVVIYDWAEWPTFHSWGLIHDSFFAAWPTLGAIVFFALGYVPFFKPSPDGPLRIAVLAWSLVAYSFLNVSTYYSPTTQYGLLIVTAAIIACLGVFASRRLSLALLALVPFIAKKLEILPQVMTDPSEIEWLLELRFAVVDLKRPLLFAASGWAIACVAAQFLRRALLIRA